MVLKPFKSSFLTLCFATSCLYTTGAGAAGEPDLYFYPKTKWTVEQVDVKSSLKTCTISNQLNNGYIVQIAGTQNGFTNLNIDFRQDIFQKNFKYEVQYTVPGQKPKVIPTKAFKQSLLVSDLRTQKEFSDAMSKSSVLDVSIRDNQFRVYLTGLEAKIGDFNECTGANAAMAQAEADALQAKEDAAFAAQNVEADLNNAAPPPPVIDIATMEAEKKAAQNQPVTDKASLRPTKGNAPRYTDLMAEQLKAESEKYKPETKGNSENKFVEQSEPEALANPTKDKEIQTSLAEPSVTVEKYQSPKMMVNKTVHEPLTADFTDTKQNKSIVASNDASELAEIEPTSGTPDTSFVDLRNKISELEEHIAMLNEKNHLLDNELKESLSASRQEQMSVSSDNWNLERATMKFNEAERQIQRLGRKLETQRSQCDMEKAELENMLFDPKLTEQQQRAKLSSLEANLEEAKSDLARQQRQYEERIRLLEAQLSKL